MQHSMGYSKGRADTLAQLFTPVAVQVLSSPLHLYGLDLYNRGAAGVYHPLLVPRRTRVAPTAPLTVPFAALCPVQCLARTASRSSASSTSRRRWRAWPASSPPLASAASSTRTRVRSARPSWRARTLRVSARTCVSVATPSWHPCNHQRVVPVLFLVAVREGGLCDFVGMNWTTQRVLFLGRRVRPVLRKNKIGSRVVL